MTKKNHSIPSREEIEDDVVLAIGLNAPIPAHRFGVYLVPERWINDPYPTSAQLGDLAWHIEWDYANMIYAYEPRVPLEAPKTLPGWLALHAAEVFNWDPISKKDVECWVRACDRSASVHGLCFQHHQRARSRWNPSPSRESKRRRLAISTAIRDFREAKPGEDPIIAHRANHRVE